MFRRLAVGDACAEDCEGAGQALKARAPIIGLFDAGGARIRRVWWAALGGYGEVFKRNVILVRVIPQISVIMGPRARAAMSIRRR